MKSYLKSGTCHFCRKDFEKKHNSPIIREGKHWFITPNDYPYKGSTHHYFIVSQKHITGFEKIPSEASSELIKMVAWLKKHLKVSGYSLFIRSGDLAYTGATLDHIHFHFLVGKRKTKNYC